MLTLKRFPSDCRSAVRSFSAESVGLPCAWMTVMNATDQVMDDATTTERIVAPESSRLRRKRQWALWGSAMAVVVIASLWYGFSRTSGPTISATVADCSQSLVNLNTGLPATGLRSSCRRTGHGGLDCGFSDFHRPRLVLRRDGDGRGRNQPSCDALGGRRTRRRR